MANAFATAFVFLGILLSLAWSVFWTSPGFLMSDTKVLHVCSGQNVDIPWSFALYRENQTVVNIEWNFLPSDDSNQSVQYLANFVHGQFLKNNLLNRDIAMVNNAGLRLSNVSMGDRGKYSVTVNFMESNHFRSDNQSIVLVVEEPPQLQRQTLEVTLNSKAVLDPDTGTWHAQLMCGKFDNPGQPSVLVAWTLPNGQQSNTTDFQDGVFHLTLPESNYTGTYQCHVNSLNDACAFNVTPATFEVKAAEVKVTLWESRLSQLEDMIQMTEVTTSALPGNSSDGGHQCAVQCTEETLDKIRTEIETAREEHRRMNETYVLYSHRFRDIIHALPHNHTNTTHSTVATTTTTDSG